MTDGIKAEKVEEPWRENLNMHVICRECKEVPPNIVEEFSSGDMVCGSCGLVLGDRIVDTRSEWRTFSNDDGANDDPSRVGDVKNDLLNGDQLTTTIAFGDGLGKSRDLHRAQNKSTHDKSNKTLLAAYKEIGALCDAWNIPKNVSDTAKHLFKMVNDAGAFRGKSQEAIIAGCIFIACRQCKVPRTFREIFALTKVSKKEIGRIFKALEKFFAAQNKEKMDSMEKDGRKSSFSAGYFLLSLLTMFFKGSSIQTILTMLPNRLRHKSCVFATAVNSGYPRNVLWCHSSLRIRYRVWDRLPDARLCPQQPHVSILCHISCVKANRPRKSRPWPASAMVLSAPHTSCLKRRRKSSLTRTGSRMARATSNCCQRSESGLVNHLTGAPCHGVTFTFYGWPDGTAVHPASYILPK